MQSYLGFFICCLRTKPSIMSKENCVNQSVKGELCKIFDEGRMVLKTLNKFYML